MPLKIEINKLFARFEDIKEDYNKGQILLIIERKTEDLLLEAISLKRTIKTPEETEEINILVKQLGQYLYDIQGLIEKECSGSL